jgi:uncharacterized protein YkwD
LVVLLAIGIGAAGFFADPARSTASVGASPTAVASARSSGTAEPAATPSAVTSRSSAAPADARSDAASMLRVHNELRAAIGAPVVRGDDRVTAAAQRHAEYLAANNAIGHDETAGATGFTGATVRDRLAAQGYNDATASEVATSSGSGVDGVRSLWLLPYHRLGLMHPQAIVAGWGHADVNGRSTTVGVIVYDFAAVAPDLVRAPATGQRVQPSWDGDESPDVLPAGASRPVGYTVMLVASSAKTVDLRAARITDGSGREVPHHVVPQIYERDYVAIIPAAPLAAATRYRVRLELSVAGVDRVEEWEFLTEP